MIYDRNGENIIIRYIQSGEYYPKIGLKKKLLSSKKTLKLVVLNIT